MRRLNVRAFRADLSKLREPVEITRGSETLGYFYPASGEGWSYVAEAVKEKLDREQRKK